MVEKKKFTAQKVKKAKPLTVDDILKYEIADELGLMDKVKATGWKSLTARESGKIGGIMSSRKKELKSLGVDIDEMKVEEIKLDK